MRVSSGILRLQMEQHHQPGMHLGRHMELDGKSLAFAIEPQTTPIKPAEHLAPLPTLNQGAIGSCTGNAGTRALAQLYGSSLASLNLDGLTLGQDPDADEKFALEVYHLATIADGFPGTYPPDDSGSSGLGVCRALKAKQLITAYHWATNGRAWATMLQYGGTIAGLPWYKSWFSPDADGFIDSGDWQASGVAGGHELYFEAIEAWDDNDPSKCVFRFHNSWGDSWGDHGCGRIRMSTYRAIQSQVDVKQLLLAG